MAPDAVRLWHPGRMGALILAILVVLVGSGLCSGSETALLSVPSVRVRQLAAEGGRSAKALLAIKSNIARPISAIVVLNNVFNIVGSIAVGTIAAAEFGEAWVGVVSGVLTFLVILFAEIMPKTLGERYALRVSLAIAIPIRALTTLMTPLVVLFEVLMRPLTKGDRGPSVSEAEIRILARMGRTEGVLEDDEVEMIQRVFHLNDRTARDLMTPRTAVTWLEAARSVDEVRDQILASEHTRIVVADGDLDHAWGVTLKHELLATLLDDPAATVGSLAREIAAVPWIKRADHLLEFFRTQREHLALVVDEYGGTIGVVTLEDVIEVLTGPIVDETDRRVDLRTYARARGRVRMARWP
ncbi:MAG: hemolysin family protein [Nitriliruptoraceae bacterium]